MPAKPENSFYITTPIYYVNDRPHIGHAYTTILADVLARCHRLWRDPTFFLTGTDEHGQKVQRSASERGKTPKEHVDELVEHFRSAWKRLDISNDDFIRTTESRHIVIVQQILQKLYDQGEIYSQDYDGWYDTGEEMFVADSDVDEEGIHRGTGKQLERVTESNYFFRMSAYQDWLIEYIESNPTFIQPDYRRNETLGFLRKGSLQDLCISRPKSRLEWGIELPFDADYVTYVWFDALVNYISTIGYGDDEANFETWWPASIHLIGKDILTTHTVYWPCMLQAMGIRQPEMIFAHGWWLMGKTENGGSRDEADDALEKMSKSKGNVIDPARLRGRVWRRRTALFPYGRNESGSRRTFYPRAVYRSLHLGTRR